LVGQRQRRRSAAIQDQAQRRQRAGEHLRARRGADAHQTRGALAEIRRLLAADQPDQQLVQQRRALSPGEIRQERVADRVRSAARPGKQILDRIRVSTRRIKMMEHEEEAADEVVARRSEARSQADQRLAALREDCEIHAGQSCKTVRKVQRGPGRPTRVEVAGRGRQARRNRCARGQIGRFDGPRPPHGRAAAVHLHAFADLEPRSLGPESHADGQYVCGPGAHDAARM